MPQLTVAGPILPRFDEILTPEALDLIATLDAKYHDRRDALLAQRAQRRREIASAGTIDFDPQTVGVRQGDWVIDPVPEALQDRRVEITGPTEIKMAINALNAGAKVWLADFEDANTPHWQNVIEGQLNLRDAHRGNLAWTSPEGKAYAVRDDAKLASGEPATVILPRPRGWHFDERHLQLDGRPVVAGIVDAALYVITNGPALAASGRGPFFYLPKTQSWQEAALWNDIFTDLEEAVGLPLGTIKATVLIETITAAFQMDEIIHALRTHMAGLNAGRWDYLFSLIKTFRDAGPEFVLPDRADVTMAVPFMRAYTELLVKTCHRRGAHAIGGMAAFIPDRRDEAKNALALGKVQEDKEREASAGYDGSWVAHPDLVPTCKAAFDARARRRTEPTRKAARRRERRLGRPPQRSRDPRRNHRRGRARERRDRPALPRGMARGPRRRRDLRADGGCGHGRDQPQPALAVDPQRVHHRRRHADHRCARPTAARRGGGRPRGGRPRQGDRRPHHRGAAAVRGGRARRRLRRVPHAAGDGADRLSTPAFRLRSREFRRRSIDRPGHPHGARPEG